VPVYQLGSQLAFPDPELAEEHGLLAIGGDLSPKRLLLAYQIGIFPWFNEGDPIYWWSPDPRFVLYPKEIKIRRSLRKVIRSDRFHITYDKAFEEVIWQCACSKRDGQPGTWITRDMMDAYVQLHRMGFAHSCEAWIGHQLAGGLYGISMGPFFFGESMFHRASNASQVALVALCERLQDAVLIDCQVETPHFERMGARFIERAAFLQTLQEHMAAPSIWEQTNPLGPPAFRRP